ncbi:MAG: hypothetical protein GQ574_07785 [Crocinitomix sp.]|nr:hypothetical protein [Crocinitomix sp.]
MNQLEHNNQLNGLTKIDQELVVNNFRTMFAASDSPLELEGIEKKLFSYLLGPIYSEDFGELIKKILGRRRVNEFAREDRLLDFKEVKESDKIAIPISNGTQFIYKKEIVYLEATSNYTKIYLRTARPILVSRTIKSFEKVLIEPCFTRIHRTYIANLTEVQAYLKSNGGELLMSNEKTLSVSKSQHQKIQNLLKIISAFI